MYIIKLQHTFSDKSKAVGYLGKSDDITECKCDAKTFTFPDIAKNLAGALQNHLQADLEEGEKLKTSVIKAPSVLAGFREIAKHLESSPTN